MRSTGSRHSTPRTARSTAIIHSTLRRISWRPCGSCSTVRNAGRCSLDERGDPMRTLMLLTLPMLVAASCASASPEDAAATIIALERGALDRWGKGDPQGYLEIYAPEVTYFDPVQERRVDGATAMQKLYGPIKGMVRVDSYEMVEPKVQQRGDVAVLTFNLVS